MWKMRLVKEGLNQSWTIINACSFCKSVKFWTLICSNIEVSVAQVEENYFVVLSLEFFLKRSWLYIEGPETRVLLSWFSKS